RSRGSRMYLVVYDTNVLISATGWRGTPFDCLELARRGDVRGLTCREILQEFEEKLKSRLHFSDVDVAATVTDALSFMHVVQISGQVRAATSDPDDDMVLDCAVSGSASHIVTGDQRHLLPLRTYHGVSI